MKRLLLILAAAAAISLLSCAKAYAGPFHRGAAGSWVRARHAHPAQPRHDHRPPTHRYNPYSYYAELYPKYYGAFHSSVILTYGYPTGDIGLRGFPW